MKAISKSSGARSDDSVLPVFDRILRVNARERGKTSLVHWRTLKSFPQEIFSPVHPGQYYYRETKQVVSDSRLKLRTCMEGK